jgi:diacylglycerol kinase (ATP)
MDLSRSQLNRSLQIPPPHRPPNGRWSSFRAAIDGITYTFRTQTNARIELAAGLAIFLLAWWLQVTPAEWGILSLTIFAILALEAVNTAVEAVVNLLSPQYHPLARIAKDAAAGAMILMVLGSICVGLTVFAPRLWGLWFSS